MDPIDRNNGELKHIMAYMREQIFNIDPAMSIHDFRMVTGRERTNLIFDVVVPYSYKGTKEELIKKIQKAASELDSRYQVIVDIDRAYVR